MIEGIVIGIIVFLAIRYLVSGIRRSIEGPACSCNDQTECPYAKELSEGAECPASETGNNSRGKNLI